MAINKKCEYYPCHKDMTDCAYCYCPIFPCKISSLGKIIELPSDKKEYKRFTWDCSKCTVLHMKENMDEIKIMIYNFIKNKYGEKEQKNGD